MDNILIVATLVIILTLIPVIIFAWHTKCPSCRQFFAEKESRRDIIDKKVSYELGNNSINLRSNDGSSFVGKTSPPQREVTKVVYFQHYICRYCNHEWKVKNEDKIYKDDANAYNDHYDDSNDDYDIFNDDCDIFHDDHHD